MGYISENDKCDTVDAARIIGVSTRSFQEMGLSPVEREGATKIYSLDDVLDLRDERVTAKAEKQWAKDKPAYDGDGLLIDVETEKKLKLRAERIAQELKNAETLGELAPLDLMRSALRDALQTANQWLESVPAIIKRANPEIAGSVLDKVERECSKVRNSIADGRINYTDERMAGHRRQPRLGDEGDA